MNIGAQIIIPVREMDDKFMKIQELIDAKKLMLIQKQNKLKIYLEKWINKEKNIYLGDLIKISKINLENSYARALCFRLFENHGVLKRLDNEDLLKNLDKQQRAIIKTAGIKIGRYHIYQPLMIKPKAVNLKIIFWNCYNNKTKQQKCPTFGLNFLKNFETKDKEFLLICGFETFENYIVRVDILEKLFIKILSSTNNNKFSISAEMLNLLGCDKENFEKLLRLMNYKRVEKDKDLFSYNFKHNDKNNTVEVAKYKEQPVIVSSDEVISIKDKFSDFQKKVLDGLQLAFKVVCNSLYGQVGASTSSICFKELAASTTATGRRMVTIARDLTLEYFPKSKLVYGDSVTGDTLIRTDSGEITIEQLYNECVEHCIAHGKEYGLWSQAKVIGFNSHEMESVPSSIEYVMRHKTKKTE